MSGAPTAAPAAKPTLKATPAGRLSDCVVGRWRLTSTKPTSGGSVDKVKFSGHGAFDLKFDRGGHYAALEAPELLVGDLRTFFAS